MVRPRIGDFLYSDDEIEVMLEDVRIFKQHGVRGIVVGILTADGRVNVERTKMFVAATEGRRSTEFSPRIVDEALPLEGSMILKSSITSTDPFGSLLPSSIRYDP